MPLLVFSNACASSHESAWRAEDPGRVFGLANAFLLAGVKFYLGTQWEIVDAHSQAFARAFYAELARGRAMGAAVRRAREAVIVAEGEGGLGWASYVLYGDPSFQALGVPDARTSQPQLPTPADIVARESIRGVVKVRMSKRDDVSGEHQAAVPSTRGGVVRHIEIQTVPEVEAARRPVSQPAMPAVPAEFATKPAKPRINLGLAIALAVILASAAVIVAVLLQ
jgi:hypothetical protein